MATEITSGSVADFYKGKCVFITGATGFLGKVLVEKLMYSSPDIDKIYVLVREKKGLDINQRMKVLLNNPLFDRLKKRRPECFEKLVQIPGDMQSSCLGLSLENRQVLIKKVSVVMHVAATTKFNEPLKVAWRINVEGTRMVLDLARQMENVQLFLHVSTAYTNTDRQIIEEVLYPPPANIDELEPLVTDNLTEEETLNIIGVHPNTYTYTKAFVEHLVAENVTYMPTVMIRPAAVSAIYKEPLKGWLDNWFGATGIMFAVAKGLLKVFYGQESNIIDFIPVDYVSNLIIVAGAKSYRSRELKIYNCSSSASNPLSYGNGSKLFVEGASKDTHYLMFPKYYFWTENSWLLQIITLMLQVAPACIADAFRLLTGRRPMYIKLQSKLIQIQKSVAFFTNRSWIIKDDRTRELYASLSTLDKELFPCDPTTINWNECVRDYARGVITYLVKKQSSDIRAPHRTGFRSHL